MMIATGHSREAADQVLFILRATSLVRRAAATRQVGDDQMELAGIHHVTAVTGHAAHNLSFYTEVMGMRLVKKTVNQDDLSAYHLFYGDAEGHPGTELTFFDWPDAGAARQGHGTISAIGLRVPGAALDYWLQRFDTIGVMHGEI